MGVSWSNEARQAMDAFAWPSPASRATAERQAEQLAFEGEILLEHLPLDVQRRWRANRPQYEWKGEAWDDLVRSFETAILSQVLAAHHGQVAASARALKTTPRIVAYKARKYHLTETKGKK